MEEERETLVLQGSTIHTGWHAHLHQFIEKQALLRTTWEAAAGNELRNTWNLIQHLASCFMGDWTGDGHSSIRRRVDTGA